jgi:hypothetical protein
MLILSEEDVDGDGALDSTEDFKLRRARIRLKLTVHEWVEGFLQTEAADTAGTGTDMRLIDAFVTLKPIGWTQLVMGEHMSPASRQNVTSSGVLMAMDRPGINYKTLTWGTRAVTALGTRTFSDSDAGLRGDVDVRDTGATLFGSGSLADDVHLKYYLGAYDGIQAAGSDDLRFTARGQVNLFDAEGGYFNSSTYLGKKKTVALGASYDTQPNVGTGAAPFDYGFYTADLFTEWPVGPGSATFECAYENLDLDDTVAAPLEDGSLPTANPIQSQGDGFYAQAGYYVNQWQPWVLFETWDSDAGDGKGGYDLVRVGVTYYIAGQSANIKAGYERVMADTPIKQTSDDTIDTFSVGVYLTY